MISAFTWAPGEEGRVALFPIRHPDIWEFRKKIEALHWTAQEVDLSRDKRDWEGRMSAETAIGASTPQRCCSCR